MIKPLRVISEVFPIYYFQLLLLQKQCKVLLGGLDDLKALGGTLRLGLYPSKLKRGSKAAAAYHNKEVVQRRHRHRYEFNNAFREQFEGAGFVFSGVSPDNRLVEIVEIPENKFFVACQYHPELSSRPNRPEELYTAFVTAAVENSK